MASIERQQKIGSVIGGFLGASIGITLSAFNLNKACNEASDTTFTLAIVALELATLALFSQGALAGYLLTPMVTAGASRISNSCCNFFRPSSRVAPEVQPAAQNQTENSGNNRAEIYV